MDNWNNENLLGRIKDPFNFKNITSLRLYSSEFLKVVRFYAIVEFKNGQTGGSQKFEGSNMDDVYIEMRTFIQQLNEKNEPK